jgi:membrane-associated phospholipid phosphatase
MAYGITYIIFREKGMEFYLLASTLSFGMTLFIIISFFWPNHIAIRPTDFPRENIFTDLVRYLYTIDTPTNVFPSIHVFNSIEVHLALCRTDHYRRHKSLIYISALFTTLIVLSTMFLKQHTVIDVIAGIVLVLVLYPFVYGRWDKYVRRFWNFFDPKYAE